MVGDYGGQVVIEEKPLKWRCSNGHHWEVSPHAYNFGEQAVTIQIGRLSIRGLCAECLFEKLEALLGSVGRVERE